MANGNSGSFTIAGTKNMSAVCYWSETYSATANSHVVSIDKVCLYSENWYGFLYYIDGTMSIGGIKVVTCTSATPTHSCLVSTQYDEYQINGVNGYSSSPWSAGNFIGKDDGTLSITISLNFTGYTADGKGANGFTISGTRTVALQTIPRTSSVSISDGTIGSEIPITITRASSSFTHTLTYSFGSTSGTIASSTSDTTVNWTPPLTLANQLPNSSSGTVTISCQTYSGSTLVGTSTSTAALTVPSSLVPSFTALTATRVDGDVPSSWGIYVQSKSKATLAITGAAGSYGSSITAYSITGGGYSSTSSSMTTGFLTTAGTITFTAKVKDSRGRWSSEKTISITVVEYSPPAFSQYSVLRCTSTGTSSANGTYCKSTVNFSYAECSGQNSVTTAVAYKKSTDSDYTETSTTFTDGTTFTFGSGNFSVEYSYDIRFSLTDEFGTISVVQTLSTASVLMDFKSGGTGLAIGKVSEKDNFECAWDADFSGKLRVNSLSDIMIGDTPLSQLIGGGASLEQAYPVGSIYISTLETNPADLLGFGRWEQIKDKFLLAGGTSYAPGTTGGEASHSLTTSELPSHSHGLNSHTHDAGSLAAASVTPVMNASLSHASANYFKGYMMRDTGTTSYSGEYAAAGSSSAKGFSMDTAMSITVSGGTHGHTVSGTSGAASGSTATSGSGSAHNNMPPYLAVYVWQRIADAPVASYTVSDVSGASYGFALNSDGYYESQNQGVQSSYALCRVDFNCDGLTMYLDCINYAESTYDFGMIGNVDSSLTLSNTADSDVLQSFSGSQSESIQTVTVGSYSGDHYIYIKYKKDSSVDKNNDSLQFKVRFE